MKTPMTCCPVTKSTKELIEAIADMQPNKISLTKMMNIIVGDYIKNNNFMLTPVKAPVAAAAPVEAPVEAPIEAPVAVEAPTEASIEEAEEVALHVTEEEVVSEEA